MEAVELKDHVFANFTTAQSHPEFTSRILLPSPQLGFMVASAGCLDQSMDELLQQQGHNEGVVDATRFSTSS